MLLLGFQSLAGGLGYPDIRNTENKEEYTA